MDQLTQIGIKWKTDKVSHGFTHFYNSILSEHRNTITNIMEIGILHQNSPNVWKDYFTNSKVVAIPKQNSNKQVWFEILQQFKNIDLVVDDGSHNMDEQQEAFNYLFKHLNQGAYYIIEDLHTSTDEYSNRDNFKRKEDLSNTTLRMIFHYLETGKIKSEYIDADGCNYLENHIKECYIYRNQNQKSSITAIFKKKGDLHQTIPAIQPISIEELKDLEEQKKNTDITDDDIKVVMEQASVDRGRALQALIKTENNLVEAIMEANMQPMQQISMVNVGNTVNNNLEEQKNKIGITDGDIKLVMEQASVNRERAVQALINTKNNLVDAIMKLTM